MKQLSNSKIKLTIGILVSNHIKYIRKGMESIKPILNSIPSELIVVDTVGPENSDGSLEVVKEYTDKIYHFDWIDDFSAARNIAIDHAQGDWFMYFDDDEYFDDVTEIIDFFRSGECDGYNYAQYYTGDYRTQKDFSKNVAQRMIRRTQNTRFVGSIHESFNEIFAPGKQFEVFTHHFGYLFETEAEREKKKERNIRLLEKELKTKGYNFRTCAHIVSQMMDNPLEAAKKSTEYIKILGDPKEIKNNYLGQFMLITNFRFMAEWSIIDVLIPLYEELIESNPLSEATRLVMCQILSCVAYVQKRYDIALRFVKDYLKLYEWLLSHEEEKIEQLVFDYFTFLDEKHVCKIYAIGVVCEAYLGNYEEAYVFIKRLGYAYCNEIPELKITVDRVLKEIKNSSDVIEYYRYFYKDEFFDRRELKRFLPYAVQNRLQG